MVLKVVRGKILETLELWCSPTARSSVLELRQEGFAIGLSKNTIILQITSAFRYYREWHSEFKEKVGGRRAQFQSGNLAPAVFHEHKKAALSCAAWAELRRPAQAELGRGTLESDANRDGPGHPPSLELRKHLECPIAGERALSCCDCDEPRGSPTGDDDCQICRLFYCRRRYGSVE